jgi:hypothetical protein
VAGASRLQVGSRGIAAITAVWLVVCGVLAMHHEASVAHVRDRAGAYVHARALLGHHAGGDADIHGQRTPDADAGDCALLTAAHQAASAHVTAPAVVTTVRTSWVQHTRHAAIPAIATAILRLAPKTSPPVA